MKAFVVKKKGLAVILAAYVGMVFLAGTLGAMTIREVVSYESRLLPIYSVHREDAVVSLGINCAWGNEDVGEIIDVLKEADVKATFFLVGEWAEKYPESVLEIYRAGHEIGTHSHTHPDMSSISVEEIREELLDSAEAVRNITGISPELFRAPSGAYNDILIKTATEEGYYTIQWNRDSLDWQDKSAEEIISRTTDEMENGDIMLLHAGAKNTAKALPDLLNAIKEKGYGAVTVGELIYRENFKMDHEGKQWLAD